MTTPGPDGRRRLLLLTGGAYTQFAQPKVKR